jgi:hypothetical protein
MSYLRVNGIGESRAHFIILDGNDVLRAVCEHICNDFARENLLIIRIPRVNVKYVSSHASNRNICPHIPIRYITSYGRNLGVNRIFVRWLRENEVGQSVLTASIIRAHKLTELEQRCCGTLIIGVVLGGVNGGGYCGGILFALFG